MLHKVAAKMGPGFLIFREAVTAWWVYTGPSSVFLFSGRQPNLFPPIFIEALHVNWMIFFSSLLIVRPGRTFPFRQDLSESPVALQGLTLHKFLFQIGPSGRGTATGVQWYNGTKVACTRTGILPVVPEFSMEKNTPRRDILPGEQTERAVQNKVRKPEKQLQRGGGS